MKLDIVQAYRNVLEKKQEEEALRRDAERFRFLRDEYVRFQPNWAAHAQSNATYFDTQIDNRMAKEKSNA